MPEPNPNQSLPSPSPEAMPNPPVGETIEPASVEAPPIESGPATKETVKPATEVGNQNAGQPAQTVNLPTPITPAAPAPAKKTDDTPTSDAHPAIADDVDVIEKEWVQKAKSIVDQHHDDPYQQEEEANKLQTSYLKKRYGKTIKKKG